MITVKPLNEVVTELAAGGKLEHNSTTCPECSSPIFHKDAPDDLRTWELLDWYADEKLGNWADQKDIEQAFAVRDYYQTVIQDKYGLDATQFEEFINWHFEYYWSLTQEQQEEHIGNAWSLEATAQFRYWRQVYLAKGQK